MINFGNLELRINTKYSFVGIEKEDSKLIFHVPRGFSQNDISTFDAKRDLFFRLYRVLNIFKQICIDKGYFQTGVVSQADDRDGVVENDSGSEIISDNDNENIFYSKIDALGSILNAYDELKILSLVSRLGTSAKLDYSKLHRFLNKGIFLNNGAVYIDNMILARNEIYFNTTDIVAMYCYIFNEIKGQLKEEVNTEINLLAESFREKYLGSEYSLFNEKHYLQVINDLKDALELIDNYTPIKDNDYWDFYEAIDKFLSGELDTSIQGKVWGFSNFHNIWESMCLTSLVKTVDPAFILYLDDKFISNRLLSRLKGNNKTIDISDIFTVKNNKIFPDAVIISSYLEKYSKRVNDQILYTLKEGKHWDIVSNKNIKYYTEFGFYSVAQDSINNWEQWIHIAYINQSSGENNHTINKLKKYFPINNDYVKVTSLPDNFYSYWDIEFKLNKNALSYEEIIMMSNLNHVFMVALNKGILNFEDFYKEYIESFQIFTVSLLTNTSKEYLAQIFHNFIHFIFHEFILIDFKYANAEYYTNPDNIEEIKKRSVRKQFVYEYLLQQHLEDTNSPLKDLDIESEFWLPADSSNQQMLTPLAKYMDGYIKLTGVNIMAVIDSYLETEEN